MMRRHSRAERGALEINVERIGNRKEIDRIRGRPKIDTG